MQRQCKGSEVGKKLSCSRNPAKAQCGWNVKEGGACGERGEVVGKDENFPTHMHKGICEEILIVSPMGE